ncbi:MAG: hypothetical protein K6C40_15295 [Thermoguttaceae bacterium]|nr:hypothetical protein [Thermoguttaceae bacterium]
MKNALALGSLFLVFAAALLLAAESRICSVCRKACTGGYYTLGDETFCSETCLGKKYSCASCGVTLGVEPNTKFKIVTDVNEEKLFFCESCIQKPGCRYCGSRKQTAMVHGEPLCVTCRQSVVSTTKDAVPLLKEAQELLAKKFYFPINPKLEMEVVSREEFERRTSSSGLPSNAGAVHITKSKVKSQFSFDEKTLTIELEEIDSGMLVVAGAPSAVAFDSIVHELTHDYLRKEDCYFIDDPLIEEGFCESIAAICSMLHGNPQLAKNRFTSDLPVYGDGFRKMYGMLKEKGWNETLKFIKSHSLTHEEYVRKNLLTCINQGQAETIKKKKVMPKIVFGKVQDAAK